MCLDFLSLCTCAGRDGEKNDHPMVALELLFDLREANALFAALLGHVL